MAREIHWNSDKFILYRVLKSSKVPEGLKHYSLHYLSGTVPTGGTRHASVKE